jgi:hypothetical protein
MAASMAVTQSGTCKDMVVKKQEVVIITLIFVLLGLTAHVTALILWGYWDHFVQVLYFDSKF